MTGKAKKAKKELRNWRYCLSTWRDVIWNQPFYRRYRGQ